MRLAGGIDHAADDVGAEGAEAAADGDGLAAPAIGECRGVGRPEPGAPWRRCRRWRRSLRGRCSSGRRRSGRSDIDLALPPRPAQPGGRVSWPLPAVSPSLPPPRLRAAVALTWRLPASASRPSPSAGKQAVVGEVADARWPTPFLRLHSRPANRRPAGRRWRPASCCRSASGRRPAASSVGSSTAGFELAAGVVPDRQHRAVAAARRRLRMRARHHAEGEEQGKRQLQAGEQCMAGIWTGGRGASSPADGVESIRFMFL